MTERNIIKNKTYRFALEVIKLSDVLVKECKEYVIAKQLLKCGTSIGANIEEANGCQSRRDFRTKIFIAYKESREARYWLRLLRDSERIDGNRAGDLLEKIEEICRILGKILSSSRQNN